MWTEVRHYWLSSNDSLVVDEGMAVRLLRGLQLESAQTQPLKPVPDDCCTGVVSQAAEQLQLTFSLPVVGGGHHTRYDYYYYNNNNNNSSDRMNNNNTNSNNNRRSYHWCVSWYDVYHPTKVAVAGAMLIQPFVEDLVEDCKIRLGGWDLQSTNHHWKDECHEWLEGAGIVTSMDDNGGMAPETVARIVTAGVGVLAREALAMQQQHPQNHNHKPFLTNNTKTGGWILKRTMLRLERELQTWNSSTSNNTNYNFDEEKNKKGPNEMEVSETIRRRGGLLRHPRVAEALRRERRWDLHHYQPPAATL
jgi:hypothetical protein